MELITALFLVPYRRLPSFVQTRDHAVLTKYVDSWLANLGVTQTVISHTSDGELDFFTTQTMRVARRVAIDEFTPMIEAEGGRWSEIECGLDQALVKVLCSAETLAVLEAEADYIRLPEKGPLSGMPLKQLNDLMARLGDMEYTERDIQDRLGADLRTKTLDDLLDMLLTRRISVVYDKTTDTIVPSGEIFPVAKSLDRLNAEIPDIVKGKV